MFKFIEPLFLALGECTIGKIIAIKFIEPLFLALGECTIGKSIAIIIIIITT